MGKTKTPREIASFLKKHDFVLVRQRGSHAIFRHKDGRWTVVPTHNRDLPHGTLREIAKRAGFSLDDFFSHF
jgi:predicted RNA binding protein YcfA (HicA-like mRNA interferase family)